MRTLIALACAVWTVGLSPCWAAEEERRFVEFPNENEIETFDLRTVQIIQPGRFTVISTTISNPDVMTLELKVLDILSAHCARPAGKYPGPTGPLTLGPPDMPIEEIVVRTSETQKWVYWFYPYKRLAMSNKGGIEGKVTLLTCQAESKTKAQFFVERRAKITNGLRMKHLFDCGRGLKGIFEEEKDDPSKAITHAVERGTNAEIRYVRVCIAVMNKMPYLPWKKALQ